MDNNSEILYVVLDTSGSMHEIAKLRTAANIVSYIRECLRLKIYDLPFKSMVLISCGREVEVVRLEEEQELHEFKAGGRINLIKLIEVLEGENHDSGSMRRLLFISDGNFSKSDVEDFSAWIKEKRLFHTRTAAVGMDADIQCLEEISAEKRAYSAEEITTVLKPWDCSVVSIVVEPSSLKDIIFKAEADEVDEWG